MAGSSTSWPEVRALVEGLGFTEGPLWLGDGRLAFTSLAGDVITLGDGQVERRVATGGGPTGLARGAGGEVFLAQCSGLWGAPSAAPAGIYRLEGDAVVPVVTAGLSAPNDLCFGPDGRLYFTDPMGESALARPEPGRLFAYDLTRGALDLLDDGLLFPNGLAFDPAGTVLYVCETQPCRVVRYPWADGRLGAREQFCTTPAGGDGMAVADDGTVWVCVNPADAVLVFSPEGSLLQTVYLGEGSYPSNCCFGGAELDRLYVTAAGRGAVLELGAGARGAALYPRHARVGVVHP